MPTVLYRVDERLIHGQVVVGWGGHLRPGRYVVVDTVLAESEWEQDLYRLGVPDDIQLMFVTPEAARRELESWEESKVRTVLLTRDIGGMLALARGGRLQGQEVNLGGLHAREGKEEVLSFLFLDEEDRRMLRRLSSEGVLVSARDLPGSSKTTLEDLLR